MRIMEIISGTRVNGVAAHLMLLSRELARRGHRVTLLCPPGAAIAERLASDSIDVLHSDLRRFPLDELRRVAAEIRQRGIDVIHTHMSRAHFFGVLLRWFAGVPCVATAHSRHFQLHWMLNDLVIAVSDATRRYHRRFNLVRASRIVTIHNFLSVAATGPETAADRGRMRAALGASNGELLLGIVGTVFPIKGHQYLIRALPKIAAAAGRVRLAIVGAEESPQYPDSLRDEARRLGVADHITWAGYRTDVPSVMAALDVCVVPSLHENLPQVVLEAMAAGLPVVATTVGGIPECVIHGETGLLVPPGDSDALARALIELLGDPARRRTLGAAARARVRDHFSAEKQVSRIEAALARVVRPAAIHGIPTSAEEWRWKAT